MKTYRTFLSLPPVSLNALSLASSVFIVCLGVRVMRASDMALEVANTKLVTSTSARRLEQLATELEQQARIIKQKDEAYQDLKTVYKRSLKGKEGYGKLQQKIELIESLPEVEPIKEVINDIEATEQLLIESSNN